MRLKIALILMLATIAAVLAHPSRSSLQDVNLDQFPKHIGSRSSHPEMICMQELGILQNECTTVEEEYRELVAIRGHATMSPDLLALSTELQCIPPPATSASKVPSSNVARGKPNVPLNACYQAQNDVHRTMEKYRVLLDHLNDEEASHLAERPSVAVTSNSPLEARKEPGDENRNLKNLIVQCNSERETIRQYNKFLKGQLRQCHRKSAPPAASKGSTHTDAPMNSQAVPSKTTASISAGTGLPSEPDWTGSKSGRLFARGGENTEALIVSWTNCLTEARGFIQDNINTFSELSDCHAETSGGPTSKARSVGQSDNPEATSMTDLAQRGTYLTHEHLPENLLQKRKSKDAMVDRLASQVMEFGIMFNTMFMHAQDIEKRVLGVADDKISLTQENGVLQMHAKGVEELKDTCLVSESKFKEHSNLTDQALAEKKKALQDFAEVLAKTEVDKDHYAIDAANGTAWARSYNMMWLGAAHERDECRWKLEASNNHSEELLGPKSYHEGQLEQQIERLAEKNSSLNWVTEAYRNLTAEKDYFRQQLDTKSQDYETQSGELKQTLKELSEKNATVTSLQDQVEAKCKEIQQLQDQMYAMNATLADRDKILARMQCNGGWPPEKAFENPPLCWFNQQALTVPLT